MLARRSGHGSFWWAGLSRGLVVLTSTSILLGPFITGTSAAPRKSPAQLCSKRGQIVPHSFFWFSAKAPTFPSGPQTIIQYALEPARLGRIYVTNGVSVARSDDLGCHWTNVYTLPQAPSNGSPFSAADSEIHILRPGVGGAVYLGIQQTGVAPRPHVMHSADAGTSWRAASGGVLAGLVGTIRDLEVTSMQPTTAFLLMDVSTGEGAVSATYGQALLRTTDAGGRWDIRSTFGAVEEVKAPVVSITSDVEMSALTADPFRPDEVWIYGSAGTFRSTDGGASNADTGLGESGLVEIFRPAPDQPGRISAFAGRAPTAQFSEDDGASFTPLAVPGVVDGAGHGADADDAVIGAGGNAYIQGPQGLFYDVSPSDGRVLRQVTATMPRVIFGRTDTTIEFTPLLGFSFPKRASSKQFFADLAGTSDPKFGGGILKPENRRIVLNPRETKTIDYTLGLRPSPTPLDVYFMIDVSSSMDGTINGVRAAMQDIINRLNALKINVHFGIGIYRAFTDPPAYERVRDIGPPGRDLEEKLNSVRSSGGGQETQLYALLRSVKADAGSTTPSLQPMTFRRHSLRVAIHATDEPISTGGGHPSYEEVTAALNQKSVKQVGLAIQESALLLGDPEDVRNTPAEGLLKVAEGTDTLAPPEGVDCDGDGENEIQFEEAIVCLISPTRSSEAGVMAEAIVNVLYALEDPAELDVATYHVGGHLGVTSPVVEEVSPNVFYDVDLKERQIREFSVTYKCDRVKEKTLYPVEIAVVTNGRGLARAHATVVCRPPPPTHKPPEKPPEQPFTSAFVPLVALAPPPIRPPDLITEPQPNPQPNPQSNPQTQAQAGFAAQQQEEPQLALAYQEMAPVPEVAEQHFMSRREPPVPPGAVFAGGAVSLALVGAFLALQRQQQVRTQRWR